MKDCHSKLCRAKSSSSPSKCSAKTLLHQMKPINHEMREGSMVVVIALNKWNVNGVAFMLIHDPEQVINVVKVADIRRINNLVTDIQMFARKSLKIPLPGRHPPSPVMSNGSIQNGYFRGRPRDQSREIERSHNSLRPQPSPHRVSPAMSSLQGYYGLVAQSDRSIPLLPEGTEMAVFKSSGRKTLLFEDDNWHQKTQISGSSFSPENFSGDNSDGMNEAEGSIRRRQKHEILFSEGEGKGSAASSGNPAMGDGSAPVRKSSSASNLGEPESSALSIWPAAASKWTLMKPDVIAKPIFDGFQKPLAAWRNKAALD